MTNNVAASGLQLHPAHHHIWLVTGPAGCGKTMVASHLAQALNIPYVEGDEVGFQAALEFSTTDMLKKF